MNKDGPDLIPEDLRLAIPQEQVTGWLRRLVTSATLEDVTVNDDSQVEYTLATPTGPVTVTVGADAVLKALGLG